jgi:hypothetical protein
MIVYNFGGSNGLIVIGHIVEVMEIPLYVNAVKQINLSV